MVKALFPVAIQIFQQPHLILTLLIFIVSSLNGNIFGNYKPDPAATN